MRNIMKSLENAKNTGMNNSALKVEQYCKYFFLGIILNLLVKSCLFLYEYYILGYSNQFNFKIVSVYTVVMIVIIVPLFEEWIFRKKIYSILIRTFKENTALIIQAAFFSVSHVGTIKCIFMFAFGILLGTVYKTKKSIIYSFLIHSGYNLMAILLHLH